MEGTNLILQIYLNEQELDEWLLSRLSEDIGARLKQVGGCQSQAMYF